MPSRFALLFSLMILMLVLSGPHAAHAFGPALVIEPRAGGAQLHLTCPQPVTDLRVWVDGQPAQVRALGEPSALPPSVVVLIEHSAALAGVATPLSTRQADAQALVARIHALAPPGTQITLLAVEPTGARVLTADAAETPVGLPDLAASDVSGPPDLGAGLSLAQQVLAEASAGPQLIVAILADAPAPTPPLTPTMLAGANLLLLGLGGDTMPADGSPRPLAATAAALGGRYFGYHTRSLNELAQLRHGLDLQLATALQAGARVSLELHGLPPGQHTLRIVGCGTPLTAPLTVSRGPALPLAPASLGALAVGLGLGWIWRQRTTVAPVVAPSAQAVDIPAEEQTTARRATAAGSNLALRLVVWDERGRTEHTLTGRQWLLGHDPGCHVVLHASGVAPLHVRLALAGDGIELTALDGVVTLGSPLGQPLAHGAPEWLALGELVCVGPSTRVQIEAA